MDGTDNIHRAHHPLSRGLFMFGEPQYIQAAVIFTLIGVVGTALSLSCHDRLDNPRLVFYLIVMASGALFVALPFV